MAGHTYDYLYRWLDTLGTGLGTKDATGDYSLAAEEFYIQPSEDQSFEIHRMIVSVGDTGGMQAEEYGNLGAALTNGITVFATIDGVETDLCDGIPIKTNASWGAVCYDVSLKTWGAGEDLLLVRWTFSRAGQPITLQGRSERGLEKMGVRLNDSFTGLTAHRFQIQGRSY